MMGLLTAVLLLDFLQELNITSVLFQLMTTLLLVVTKVDFHLMLLISNYKLEQRIKLLIRDKDNFEI